jgi:uncharacterized protein (DUF2062 family)
MNLLVAAPDAATAATVANFAAARGWPPPTVVFPGDAIPAAARRDADAVLTCPTGIADDDLAALVDAAEKDDTDAVILGARPGASLPPAVLLSMQLLTGEDIPDWFSPLILHPPALLGRRAADLGAASLGDRLELLVAAARGGCRLLSVEVASLAVVPSPSGAMPAAFLLRAFGRALLPWPYRRVARRPWRRAKFAELVRHPSAFFGALLRENATPAGLGVAATVGMFLGTLPLIFVHTAVILYVCIRWRLNKVMAVSISQLCMPPLLPFACIELGHRLRHGRWLDEVSLQTVVHEAHLRFGEWLLGAMILAPLNAAAFGFLVFGIAKARSLAMSRPG